MTVSSPVSDVVRSVLSSVTGDDEVVATPPPYTDDITAWYDANDADTLFQEISSPSTPSTAGDVVGTILDKSGNDYHMAAPANGNRGSLLTLNSANRIRLLSASSHRYTNATIPINRRAGAIFFVGRNFGSSNAQTLMHFPASGGSTMAFYNSNSTGPTDDPLTVYDGGNRATGLKFGYRASLETTYLMGGASQGYAGIGPQLFTYGSGAWAAGSTTGGNIGYWNGAFPANYEFAEILVYDRELSLSEKNEVLDWLEARHPVVGRSEDRFIIATGDSITEGNALPGIGDTDSYLVQLLNAYSAPPKAVNNGAGGQQIQNVTAATREIAALTGASTFTHRLLTCMWGVNDIGSGGRTGAQVNADIDTYLSSLNTADSGAKILWLSILPNDNFNATQDGHIATVNAHLASLEGSTIDYYVNAAADSRLSDPTNTTYYSDGLHPTVAGEAVIAELIKSRLDSEGWGA